MFVSLNYCFNLHNLVTSFELQYPSFIVHQSYMRFNGVLMHNKWRALYKKRLCILCFSDGWTGCHTRPQSHHAFTGRHWIPASHSSVQLHAATTWSGVHAQLATWRRRDVTSRHTRAHTAWRVSDSGRWWRWRWRGAGASRIDADVWSSLRVWLRLVQTPKTKINR